MALTHCPFCRKYIAGTTRSFCANCHEAFDQVDDRWFSTNEVDAMDSDSDLYHF
jgi:hypothetical protein